MDLARIRKKKAKKGSAPKEPKRQVAETDVDEKMAHNPSESKEAEGAQVEQAGMSVNEGRLELEEFLLFRLGDELYSIPMKRIQEIINIYGITPVPRAPEHLKGIISLRGKIIPVIDLKKLLSINDGDDDSEREILLGARMVKRWRKKGLVLEGVHGPISLLTDSVIGVVRIDPTGLHLPPSNLSDEQRRYLQNVFVYDERVVSVLNPDEVLYVFPEMEVQQ